MRVYAPDRWVMLKATSKSYGSFYRVLGSWYGGFAGSNSWKLSSGTVDAIYDEEYKTFHFPQESGSTYVGSWSNYGMSNLAAGVLRTWQETLKSTGAGSMELLEENFDIALMKSK